MPGSDFAFAPETNGAVVIVEVRGGMGNQFFQYAVARNLALKYDCPLYFELSDFDKQNDFGYALDKTNAVGAPLPAGSGITPRSMRKQRLIPRMFLNHKVRFFKEKSLSHMPEILTLKPPVYLHGYFQSTAYFAANKARIIDELRPVTDLDAAAFRTRAFAFKRSGAFEQSGAATGLVSVHVRRGDYLKPGVLKHLGILGRDYYARAMQRLLDQTGVALRFVVFSDDAAAARDLLDGLPFDTVQARDVLTPGTGTGSGDPAIADMTAMAACDHHIIANSSFSWWGSAFGRNPDRITLCPSPWFADGTAPGFGHAIGGCTPLAVER